MTGKGRCVQDDRGKECCVRNGKIDLLFRFKRFVYQMATEPICDVNDFRVCGMDWIRIG